MDVNETSFSSELGKEILHLKLQTENKGLDPTRVKNILSLTEDTRVAERLSELESEGFDDLELRKRRKDVLIKRFNLLFGQQCIRDLFICLQENAISWPDVSCHFNFTIQHSTVCCNCEYEFTTETNQVYLEMAVPPHDSCLNTAVESYFNTSDLITKFCGERCRKMVQAEKRSQLKNANEADLIVIILSRASGNPEDYHIDFSEVHSTNDIFIR